MTFTNMFRTDGWVKATTGYAVPGAQVWVCQQPANTASLPPSPLANIFSDVNGLVPITQPIITDGFGHYNFYTAAGVYTVVVALNGVVQQVYPDQSVGGASGTSGGGGGTALVLQVNGTNTTNQLLANFEGTGGTTVTADGAGDIIINSPVVPPPLAFSTAGQGFLFPGAFIPFVVGSSITSGATSIRLGAGTANQIGAVQFELPFSITIRSISMYVVTGAGSGYATTAIYDITGTIKYVDAGANAFDTHTASQVLRTVTLATPVTLAAGIYWWATASTDVSGSIAGYSIYQYVPASVNTNAVRYGTAANSLVAGAMPSSLGTITGFATSNTTTIPIILFNT